jgi:hypothetical protein
VVSEIQASAYSVLDVCGCCGDLASRAEDILLLPAASLSGFPAAPPSGDLAD